MTTTKTTKKKTPVKKAKKTNVKKLPRKNHSPKTRRTRTRTKKQPITRTIKRTRRKSTALKRRTPTKTRTPKNRILASARKLKSSKNRARRKLRDLRDSRVSVDTRYWLQRKSNDKPMRARYSTKSIRTPRTTTNFRIRKKVKAISIKPRKEALKEVAKGMIRYLKLTKTPRSAGKKTYIKLMIRDQNGNTRWVSSKRKEFFDRDDVVDRLRALQVKIRGYGSDFSIVGYEAEENI